MSIFNKNWISSGDPTLNDLLGGLGFLKGIIYLIFDDTKNVSNILLTTTVAAQRMYIRHQCSDTFKIVFIDANNGYNPSFIAKTADFYHLSPKEVEKNINLLHVSTYEYLVQILENQLPHIQNLKVVLISGLLTLFKKNLLHSFEGLSNIINSIRMKLSHISPFTIITSTSNKALYPSKLTNSKGKSCSAFVQITEDELNVIYKLLKHPRIREKQIKRAKSMILKLKSKSLTLDCFF